MPSNNSVPFTSDPLPINLPPKPSGLPGLEIVAWQARGMNWWNRLTPSQRDATMQAFAVRFPGAMCSVAACFDAFEEPMPEPPVTWGKDAV